MTETLRAEAFHDAWISRGMTCAGTHAFGEALCQNVTATLAHLAAESPSPGTTTHCPLHGVHEHAFRGPHVFREWDPDDADAEARFWQSIKP